MCLLMMIKTICKSSGSVKCAKRMSDTAEATSSEIQKMENRFSVERKASQIGERWIVERTINQCGFDAIR
jgi:hypothetical protein